jgi:hypothetical protein
MGKWLVILSGAKNRRISRLCRPLLSQARSYWLAGGPLLSAPYLKWVPHISAQLRQPALTGQASRLTTSPCGKASSCNPSIGIAPPLPAASPSSCRPLPRKHPRWRAKAPLPLPPEPQLPVQPPPAPQRAPCLAQLAGSVREQEASAERAARPATRPCSRCRGRARTRSRRTARPPRPGPRPPCHSRLRRPLSRIASAR